MTAIFFDTAGRVAQAQANFLLASKKSSGGGSPAGNNVVWRGAQPLALAGVVASLAEAGKKILLLCRDTQEMELQKQLLLCHQPHLALFSFPPFDSTAEAARARATALFALQNHHGGMVLLTSYHATMEHLPPPAFVANRVVNIAAGKNYPMARLLENLLALGYERTAEVRTVGDMVRHGGIIDIFPIAVADSGDGAMVAPQHLPLRIDFFGDQVEGIYYFSPLDQRRLTTPQKIAAVKILPNVEMPFDKSAQKTFLFRMREEFSLSLPPDIFDKSFFDDDDLQYYRPLFFGDGGKGGKGDKGGHGLLDYLGTDFMVCNLGRADNEITQQWAIVDSDYHDRAEEYAVRQPAKNTAQKNKKINNINDIILPPLPPEKIILSPAQWQAKAENFFTLQGEAENHDNIIDIATTPLDSGWQQMFVDLSHNMATAHHKNHEKNNDKNNDGDFFYQHLFAAIKNSPTSLLVAAHNTASLHRWQKILAGDDMPPVLVADHKKSFSDFLLDKKKKIILAVMPLRHGEQWGDDLTIITDHDVFQVEFQLSPSTAQPRTSRATVEKLIKDITTLKTGDLITHIDYGIGQFLGLKPITAGGRVHDCVALAYRDGDKVYLPIENLDRLQRYGDLPDPAPPLNGILDKLGSADWQMRVAKTRAHIKELAEKLARNAALRQTIKATPLVAKDSDYLEFASLFPYPETRDQEQAIIAVKNDLATDRPMDRLICGDVGFGKTEVALRASFCAVMAGKQVLVVTPTTLLARQHYHHFVKRFKNVAVRIKQLSRFVSPADAKKTKEEINDGAVDIVVGTHGLLHRSVMPKNLGLVIIDEEHHFGVKQKERARELAKNVHLLAMSATPIPRSLQLSLHGIKDLSLIATPPPGRLPIKTTVAHLDPFDIKRVIKNELARGGQIFFVAPRINQLPTIKKSLGELVPEMAITIAHGQMPGDDVDQAMTDFADRKYQGLLSTNIIESGLDLPNVNTIIIFHGDQFGLAQLYQLRGRVGRSTKQGYCFITYPKEKPITKNAKKRLELLDDLNHLGAGFTLASHDLDMRGAGNLLGEEQSGHIKEVGVELYQKMVMAALAKLSEKDFAPPSSSEAIGQSISPSSSEAIGQSISPSSSEAIGQSISPSSSEAIGRNRLLLWSPHIVLPLAVAIPEDYIPDEMVRLALYKELSEAFDEKNLQEIQDSLRDRFGPIPPETKNLLSVIELKQLCYAAHVSELKITPPATVNTMANPRANPNATARASMSVVFYENKVRHPDKLLKLITRNKARVVKESKAGQIIEKIIFPQPAKNIDQLLASSKKLLAELC